VIEYFEYRNRTGPWGKITEEQGEILQVLDTELPADAWPKSIRKKLDAEQKAKRKQLKEQENIAKSSD